MQPPYRLFFGLHQRVERYIKPEGFKAGARQHEILYEEPLAASDVEHAHAGLETKMLDDVARPRQPAAVIVVSAIAVFARSIEIHLAVLFGDGNDRGILRLLALLDVAFRARKRTEQV